MNAVRLDAFFSNNHFLRVFFAVVAFTLRGSTANNSMCVCDGV